MGIYMLVTVVDRIKSAHYDCNDKYVSYKSM